MSKQKKTSTKPEKPTSGTATFVRPLREWHADARLFKANPPIDGCEDIIVVSAKTPYGFDMCIWGLLENDRIKYGLARAYHTTEKDHRGALSKIGYTMVGDVVRTPRPKIS